LQAEPKDELHGRQSLPVVIDRKLRFEVRAGNGATKPEHFAEAKAKRKQAKVVSEIENADGARFQIITSAY
jgi:hypothetical protein